MGAELCLLLVVYFATVTVMIAFFVSKFIGCKCQALIFLYLSTSPYPDIERELTEKVFYDPKSAKYIKFPFGLSQCPEVDISIIVPAFNEARRRSYAITCENRFSSVNVG